MSDDRLEGKNEVSLKEYVNEKLARQDDRVIRLERLVESGFSARDQQRIEDKQTLEIRLSEHQAAHDREHSTAEKNAEKDEKKLDSRLLTMNEIREQLNSQAATFARQDWVEAKVTGLAERTENADKNLISRLDAIDKTLAAMAGRSGGSMQTVGFIFAGLGALSTIVGLVLIFSGNR